MSFLLREGFDSNPIPPKLFSATLEMVLRNLDWDRDGLSINGETLNHLRFANDLILFPEYPKGLEQMLQQILDEIPKAGLSMNINKTKIITKGSQFYNITINMEEIDYVEK
ncbi:Putative uncharacterized transposon-derived protein F52C9.6 [Eumeta japonica]|uniref:Uncharacterized transposon-derived protein F52C9.6 n=1 Tax=Eumeta variegata TaxID=151549 RepID=A0A4C1WGV1_EUMVA|nr:Putative uncharacterized transposon-derived protein F52C9.6 [Eumeta japonica]